MKHEDFVKKYSQKYYLGDGLYVRFDGYHFILSTERENGVHWVGLEPPVFDAFIEYRKQVYDDHHKVQESKEWLNKLKEQVENEST